MGLVFLSGPICYVLLSLLVGNLADKFVSLLNREQLFGTALIRNDSVLQGPRGFIIIGFFICGIGFFFIGPADFIAAP